jgi:hypothetical protein
MRDGEFDGRQGPRGQDRACDDDAAGRLLLDHEIGPDRQHRRLQDHAENLRGRAEPARDIGGLLLRGEVSLVRARPERRETAAHPHRAEHLGVAPACFRKAVARHAEANRGPGRLPGEDFREERQHDENQRAHERRDADPEMEGEADEEIERDPGHVEERGRARARQETADLIEVAERLQPVACGAALQGQPDDVVVDTVAQRLVEACADPSQDSRPYQVDHALKGIENEDDRGERDERRDAAAGEHPVVDLQHVKGAREHEDVQNAAHDPDADKGGSRRGQHRREFAAR